MNQSIILTAVLGYAFIITVCYLLDDGSNTGLKALIRYALLTAVLAGITIAIAYYLVQFILEML